MPRRSDQPSISLSLVLLLGACATQPDDAADDTSTSTGTEGTSTSTGTETGDEPAECESDRCNPLDLSDCAEDEICIFFNTEFQCLPFTGDGSGVAGAPCDSATACNPGLACIQSVFFSDCAGDACCSPNCFVDGTVDGSGTCPNADAGEVCDAWSLGAMADPCYENVGVCSTPP